jgi:hypothetical protein
LIPGSAGYRDLSETGLSRRITFLGGLLDRRFRARSPSLSVFLEDSYPLLTYFAGLFEREVRDAAALS